MPRKVIDAQNEQEFPSLGNASVAVRPQMALNSKAYGTSGLARTKENFPALGGSSVPPAQLMVNNAPPASAVLFKSNKAATKTASSTKSAPKQKPQIANSPADFPALPGGASFSYNGHRDLGAVLTKQQPSAGKATAKKPTSASKSAPKPKHQLADFPVMFGSASHQRDRDLEDDFIPSQPSFNIAAVSAKYRALVPTYESMSAASAVSQKLKTVQQVDVKSDVVKGEAPKLNSNKLFPSLNSSSAPVAAPQWLNASKAKQPTQSRPSKVAPAPVLPQPSIGLSITTKKEKKNKPKANDSVSKAEAKQPEGKSDKKGSKAEANGKEDKATGNAKSKKESKPNAKPAKALQNGVQNDVTGTVNSYSAVTTTPRPPPGFGGKTNGKTVSVPPGFEAIAGDNQTQCFSYISPSNALKRNQVSSTATSVSLRNSEIENNARRCW